MRNFLKIIIIAVALVIYYSISQDKVQKLHKPKADKMEFKVQKSDEQWKKELTPEQYRVLREKGTERPFTGEYNNHSEVGLYTCAACGAELFRSDGKFNSSCGWPSFFEPVSDKSVIEKPDYSYNMVRTEILCGSCGGHLGHVFDDGPPPTGLRYCINSVSLKFQKDK